MQPLLPGKLGDGHWWPRVCWRSAGRDCQMAIVIIYNLAATRKTSLPNRHPLFRASLAGGLAKIIRW
ncbi:hypothetical protein PCLA_07f0417 [Pseudomonas citronellolis]|nr:hypothetical protein PCLA_07f0417 [Pseudomonas citronellolis]